MAAVAEEAGAEDETLLAEQRALEPQNAAALTLSLLQVQPRRQTRRARGF